MLRFTTLLTSLSFTGCAFAPNTAVNVRVVPGPEPTCLYETIPTANENIFFHYAVTAGGNLKVQATVSGPDSQVIWEADSLKDTQRKVNFKAKSEGTYSFCFASTDQLKTVAFTVVAGDAAADHPGRTVDPMRRSMIHISESIAEVKNSEQHLRIRERIHRDTTESTNTRVMVLSVLELLAIVGGAVGQMWYIRSCFEKQRRF